MGDRGGGVRGGIGGWNKINFSYDTLAQVKRKQPVRSTYISLICALLRGNFIVEQKCIVLSQTPPL